MKEITHNQAKDQVAKKYGFDNWEQILAAHSYQRIDNVRLTQYENDALTLWNSSLTTEIERLKGENERLKNTVDFNVKENMNILRQLGESAKRNEKLRTALQFVQDNGIPNHESRLAEIVESALNPLISQDKEQK